MTPSDMHTAVCQAVALMNRSPAVEQCKAAGVPCFVKQLGARPFLGQGDWQGKLPQMRDHLAQRGEIALRDRKGGDPAEWPADLRVREMPR